MNTELANNALSAIQRSLHHAVRTRTVAHILERQSLRSHYQPIVQLSSGEVVGHESLVRGPVDSPLFTPDALFEAARREHLVVPLEEACIRSGVDAWSRHELSTRLFLNLSASAIIKVAEGPSFKLLLNGLSRTSVSPSALVIEITEHDQVTDMPRLIAAATRLRALGLRFALDDFGEGRSSLRLWAELRPEIVKIDKYFVHELDRHAVKIQTIRGIKRFAETFDTVLVAEGIETGDELRVLRDLGIDLGQGYFLGRPGENPAITILAEARAVIDSALIAVLPEMSRATGADLTVDRLLVRAQPIDPDVSVDTVARHFADDSTLRAVALVRDGRPVGLLNRQTFVDGYARPYFKELYGRKPCMLLANATPLVLERHSGIEAMTAVLTSSDQRYLTEGFIVTEGGRYAGLGTGEQLVRAVTEARIEAARHANPLTFLPGNIPTTEHIERLIGSTGEFVACYADLNSFKPFNDHYGYWRGDEMLRLVAKTLIAHCDPRRDFVGHVGGDDFVVLFQSVDWMARCERIVATFNESARNLFDAEARKRGGIEAEDRYGVVRFFPFTSLSIGAVPVRPDSRYRSEDVASAAAAAKHKAKISGRGLEIEASLCSVPA
jgi:diguanylate cyclase (GGDEF)-like protein